VKAVFLDRDGVINQKAPEGEYVTQGSAIHYLSDVFSAVAALDQAGFKVIIVTNQRGIALGKVRPADLEDIHSRMRKEFARKGGFIPEIYVCPHDYGDHCSCRKPKPGMLIKAARDHGLDLDSSWMIGDAESDVEAGKRAGCKTVRILPFGLNEPKGKEADICSPSLAAAVRLILLTSNIASPFASV
jgi:D-glycero-D-manno-heptose 1,7-bisphosphate phosphatase